MGTWCTIGIERQRRDAARVATIQRQREYINADSQYEKKLEKKIKRLEAKIRKLKRELKATE